MESRQQISWIWQTSSQGNAGINNPDLQDVMRVEWCKAIARADQFWEEVELVVEEMKRTLLFFKWTVNHWEQLGDNHVGEPTMDWYECLETKSLRSGWLSEYPHPEACRRRQLQSNVATYHLFTPHMDEMDSALKNNSTSDSEDSVTATGDSDVEMDFLTVDEHPSHNPKSQLFVIVTAQVPPQTTGFE